MSEGKPQEVGAHSEQRHFNEVVAYSYQDRMRTGTSKKFDGALTEAQKNDVEYNNRKVRAQYKCPYLR